MKNITQIILAGLVMLLPGLVLAASQSGAVTMDFDLSRQANNADTRLWIPYPLSDRDQLITKVKVTGDFVESAVYSDRIYSTPMLYQYRVKLATGRDIVLNPAQTGPPLTTFGYPYAEIGAKVLDFYDPATFSYKITYRR